MTRFRVVRAAGVRGNQLELGAGWRTGRLEGFRYFWAKKVVGFDPAEHCAKCLVGPWGKCSSTMQLGRWQPVELGAVAFYICGVAKPFRWENNFHLAFVEGRDLLRVPTWNGFEVQVEGARRLEIPALPNGFGGRGAAFTTCRNFQFGVARFPKHPWVQRAWRRALEKAEVRS